MPLSSCFLLLFSYLSEHRNVLAPGRGGSACKASWGFSGAREVYRGWRCRATTPTTNPPRFPSIGISFQGSIEQQEKKDTTLPTSRFLAARFRIIKKRSRRQAIIVFLEGIICTLTLQPSFHPRGRGRMGGLWFCSTREIHYSSSSRTAEKRNGSPKLPCFGALGGRWWWSYSVALPVPCVSFSPLVFCYTKPAPDVHILCPSVVCSAVVWCDAWLSPGYPGAD